AVELLVLLAFDGNELIGIAPLCIEKKWINGIPEKVLTFIGAPNLASDYVDFIIKNEKQEVLEDFLLTIRQNCKRWTLFSWPNMPGFSVNRLRTEEYFSLRRFSALTTFMYDAPVWERKSGESDKEVLEKKSVKRQVKTLEKLGELDFCHLDDSEDAHRELSILVEQHKTRWAGTKYPSLFNDEKQVEFYHSIIDEMWMSGVVKFSRLCIDQCPVALHFGFEYNRSYLWYKPSFDQEYAQHSPGQVLLFYLLKYSAQEQLREFDFGCGSEFFKYRFSNNVRKIYKLNIYQRKSSALIARLRSGLRSLKKKKK
ncbi:MAG: GNAT family N-acetyltransferase, partial [Bdellovibrionales bacterium]|nr:GNAT family N-acetyltransferase [Bdellovibrionales bacterium]